MKRRLIAMRHAKSSWTTPGLADILRPLNARGQRSAQALGKWLRYKGYRPDHVLCSAATRTAQTFDALGLELRPHLTTALYDASASELLDQIRQTHGACVLLIGHNPGIADFASDLAIRVPAHPRFEDFPTGATLVMEFSDQDWKRTKPKTGSVLDFVVPRELAGAKAL